MAKKPTTFYRDLLANAWRITWNRKSLWVFGLFAALITTGGVVDVAFRSFRRIEQGRDLYEALLSGSFIGYEIFAQYIAQLSLLGSGRVTATVIFLSILLIALIVLAVLSQGALIVGAARKQKKELSLAGGLHAGGEHFWNILALDLLLKVATILLIILSTLPLVLFLSTGTLTNAILYFVLFLLFFPLIVIVNIIAMLALIDIVKNDRNAFDAIQHALALFGKHWLVTFELGVILFFLVLFVGLGVFAFIILLSVPYAILLVLSQFTGLAFLFILINAIGFILLATILFTYAGGAVAFQYTAWLLLYERMRKRTTMKSVVAKVERLFAKLI